MNLYGAVTKGLLAAGVLFLALDVLFVGAPALGMYAGLALLAWLIPRTFLAWGKPDLRRHRATVALMYVSFPPFGRRVLNVETREWSSID